jgi:hypothetical protein
MKHDVFVSSGRDVWLWKYIMKYVYEGHQALDRPFKVCFITKDALTMRDSLLRYAPNGSSCFFESADRKSASISLEALSHVTLW